MPATETPWRNTKLLHVIFGVTSLGMLLVTLWMFMDDHNREWKHYQQTFYSKVEVWNLQGRILEQMAQDYDAGLKQRKEELKNQQKQTPEPELLDLFVAEQRFFDKYQESKDAKLAENYAAFVAATKPTLTLKVKAAETAVQLHNLEADAAREKDEQRKADMERHAQGLKKQLSALQAQLKEALKDVAGQVAKLDFMPKKKEAKDKRSRAALLADLREQIATARFNEEYAQRELKFRRADLDVVRGDYGLAVGNSADKSELSALQAQVTQVRNEVSQLDGKYAALNRHRKQLDEVLKAITAGEAAAQKAVDDFEANVARLKTQKEEAESGWGNALLGIPILDAFNNSQITLKGRDRWLPNLTLDRNFNQVARFDRCEACHLGMLKATPEDPLAPAYERRPEFPFEFRMATGSITKDGKRVFLKRNANDQALPAAFADKGPLEDFVDLLKGETAARNYSNEQLQAFVLRVYGIQLAKEGLWKEDEPIVEFVLRESAGAEAGLQRGDVITAINGIDTETKDLAFRYLVDHDRWGKADNDADWGRPLEISVERGVPHPYSTHPRLDLYGTDLSPHPFGKFGCTICHDGQGNGTAFKWASHTPNSLSDAKEWSREHGWFDDVHWIFPMRPKRFAESNCLKCHHGLTELESSEKFPEPSAPKLMAGYHTIRKFGCFGCHEIKGYDGPDKRIGPDLRLEPNYFAVADQLRFLVDKQLKTPGLPEATPEFLREVYDKAFELRNHPADRAVRRELQQLLATDAGRAEQVLSTAVHALSDGFKDEETPGNLRKVGPSLRHVKEKLDARFIYNQIRNPRGFRPTSRMPQFFSLFDHFDVGPDYDPKLTKKEQKVQTEQFEKVEILAAVEYLRSKSQPLEQIDAPSADALVKMRGSNDRLSRGKFLFGTRCVACHQHTDFPGATQDQGPDLSHIGDKLPRGSGGDMPDGRKWLYNWLRQPTNYHSRTRMPDNFLMPYDDKATKKKIDPALEIAEFLLASRAEKPFAGEDLPSIEDKQLVATLRFLAVEHLRGGAGFTESQANSYLDNGIPLDLAPELKGDEVELLGDTTDANKREKMLVFVGRRTISKYGCYACHDIPGFETSKPIGTGLADWGRKETSKIAFEQIGNFVALHEGGHGGDPHHLNLEDFPDKEKAYFLNSLTHHQREGFLWQKLRDPRSFDFEKTQNKGYNERLKMPQFRFHPDEDENANLREQVMTFILGLVSEPPADEYLYRPDPRKAAIDEGRRVLTKYNCGGCHTLEMDTWRIEFRPDDMFLNKPAGRFKEEYPFLIPHVSSEQRKRSLGETRGGMRTATITGRQARQPVTGEFYQLEIEDQDTGKVIGHRIGIELWKPAVINGGIWLGDEQVLINQAHATQVRPATGGMLSRLIPPMLLAEEKKTNPAAQYEHTLAWAPPPLIGEGTKVQTDWLHDFLLDPYQIRPSVALRMPKFNMSAAEASILVNYFAAIDGAEYPYTFNARRRDDHLRRADERIPGRLEDAKKLIANGNFCLKCHHMGDPSKPPGSEFYFVPEGDSVSTHAPNLAQVYRRLRPDFVRRWVANPARLLPYTGMPVNIKDGTPVAAKLFTDVKVGQLMHKQGITSRDQLDAVVDFLMNYDRYSQQNETIKINSQPKEGDKKKEGS